MLRYLPVLLILALVIYCLVECIQTPSAEVRNLPKWAWIILIVVLDVIGCAAWFFAGRPKRQPSPASGSATSLGWLPGGNRGGRPLAPDDDPEFLKGLKRPPSEHDRLLDEWERELRRGDKAGTPPDSPSSRTGSPGASTDAGSSGDPAARPDDDSPDPSPDPSPEDPPARS